MAELSKEQRRELLELQTKRKLENVKAIKLEVEGKVTEITQKKKAPKAQGFKKKERFLRFPFRDRWKLDKTPTESYIVTMLFSNGTLKTFVIKTTKPYFKMKDKTYAIIYEECYFDISLNQFHLYYSEGHPIPINREIQQVGSENFFTVTPENLEPLIKQQYVKALVGAEDFVKTTKILLVLVVVNLIATLLIIILIWGAGR